MGATCIRRWAYANAKATDEFMALAHYHETQLPVVVVRLFNTVGPRQTGQYGMVIPRLVRQALQGKPLTVFGDGTQTRCFTHVSDVVDALWKIMNCREAKGQVVNIGNNQEISIMQLAQRIVELTGTTSKIELIPYSQAYGEGFEDMQRRVPCLDKANRLIGYKPTRSLDDILKDVIAWEKAFPPR